MSVGLQYQVDERTPSLLINLASSTRSSACYVGATSRHLQIRFKEHISRKSSAVAKHLELCNVEGHEMDREILSASLYGEVHLFTMEALWIRQLKPKINVKDEYRSRELIIKF